MVISSDFTCKKWWFHYEQLETHGDFTMADGDFTSFLFLIESDVLTL